MNERELDYTTDIPDDEAPAEVDEQATTAADPPANDMEVPPGMRAINPFVAFRNKNATGSGFLKCDVIKMDHNTGALIRERGNNKTVLEDRRFTVNPNLMIERWAKWVGGKLVDQKIYRTAEGELAPADREEFGLDLDEDNWPRDGNGRVKDPWQREVYLPMKGADGDEVVFKATSKSAISEIGEFLGMYGSADRHGKIPLVNIEFRTFDTERGSTVHVPVFRLQNWALWDGQPVPMARPMLVPIAAPTAAKPKKALPKPRSDMDDSIPF
jgi:hypothetical protein